MGVLVSILAWLMPPRATEVHTATKPAMVAVTTAGDRPQTMSLSEVVRLLCPSVYRTFEPPWWLRSGHVQTAYCVFGDFSYLDSRIAFERVYLRTLDGGTIGLDFTSPKNEGTMEPTMPIVVICPGLTGGSTESYVRELLIAICGERNGGGLGYRAVVVNPRGCAGVPVTSPRLYSAGTTDDLRAALLYVAATYPDAPLMGLGFSLGASVLARYLAEEGSRSRLKAACTLGCPWDLFTISQVFVNTWWRRQLYACALGSNLRALVQLHAAELSASPAIAEAIPRLLAITRPNMRDYDGIITCIAGGDSRNFPFNSVDEYYTWASCLNLMADIRVPLLALHAADDPIITEFPQPAKGWAVPPWIVLAITAGGGHLGWFQDGTTNGHFERWFVKPAADWLRAMESVQLPDAAPPRAVNYKDGYWREDGLEHIACRVASDVTPSRIGDLAHFLPGF